MTRPSRGSLLYGEGEARVFRAERGDLPAIVDLLADDPLGASREGSDLAPYERAFAAIDANPADLLIVVSATGSSTILATAHLTLVPGLARQGRLRLNVEAVRVAREARGTGLGRALFGWIEDFARARGAGLIQLTSDKSRERAHHFYRGLGYEQSHEGFKFTL